MRSPATPHPSTHYSMPLSVPATARRPSYGDSALMEVAGRFCGHRRMQLTVTSVLKTPMLLPFSAFQTRTVLSELPDTITPVSKSTSRHCTESLWLKKQGRRRACVRWKGGGGEGLWSPTLTREAQSGTGRD